MQKNRGVLNTKPNSKCRAKSVSKERLHGSFEYTALACSNGSIDLPPHLYLPAGQTASITFGAGAAVDDDFALASLAGGRTCTLQHSLPVGLTQDRKST